MRHTASYKALQILVWLAIVIVPGQARAGEAEPCTMATLDGSYGLLQRGTLIGLGPFASIGLAVFDGKGAWTLTDTVSVNGNISTSQGQGSYSINADCTGTLVLNLGGRSQPGKVVVLDGGREVQTMLAGPGTAVTGVLKKTRRKQCKEATLRGTYDFDVEGIIVGVGPLVSIGIMTFDGSGSTESQDTTSINGQISENSVKGTFSVNSDCTGIGAIGPRTRVFVIVNGGREILEMLTTPNAVITGRQILLNKE